MKNMDFDLSGYEKQDITAEELASLLKDRVFVDYFNVYLSLPITTHHMCDSPFGKYTLKNIFAQHVLYKFDDRDFLFDPPLKRTGQILNRRMLTEWLLKERVPHFMKSELYLEYVVCKALLDTEIKLTCSSHRLDYDKTDSFMDKEFLQSCIGHVIGMCKLRRYLEGTTGELVLQFCKDAERFHQIPATNVDAKRHLFRVMQVKYFRTTGIVCSEHPRVWEALSDSYSAILEEIAAADGWSTQENPDCSSCTFHHLTIAMRRLLMVYWLPRYILHCRAIYAKQPTDLGDQYKVRSLSDIRMLRQLKDIDQILKFAQGNLKPCRATQRQKSGVTWNALFPHCQVDDTFLTSSEDVVTMHADGRLVVEPMDSSKLQLDLDTYTQDIDSSTSITSNESAADTHATPGDSSPYRGETYIRPGSNLQNAIARAEESRGTPQTATEPEEKSESPTHSSTENVVTESQSIESVNMESVNMYSKLKPMTGIYMRTELELERKLPVLTHKQNKSESSSKEGDSRPRTCPSGSLQRHSLPLLSESRLKTHKLQVQTSELTFLPPIYEASGREYSYSLEPCRWRNRISIHPLTSEYNISAEVFRREHRFLIAALASDSCAGGPMKGYLKSSNDEAWVLLNFWRECHVYLTLERILAQSRDVQEHVRFRRACTLILQHLLPGSEFPVNLPASLKEVLVKQLQDRMGNDLLRHAQNMATTILTPHWKEFCQRDRDIFMETVVTMRTPKRQWSAADAVSQYTKNLRSEDWPPTGGDQDFIAMAERRAYRALQFAMDIMKQDPDSVCIDALPLDDLEYEIETQEGSLAVKKLAVVRKFELQQEEYRRHRAILAARMAEMNRARTAAILSQSQEVEETDDTPPFARPFRRDGKWVHRPERPRTFAELMRNTWHVEFFRRFLSYHRADIPLQFWLAVEELKLSKDPKQRQQLINQILRKFFLAPKRFAALDPANAEVVREIPNMTKVTPAILISAQTCISSMLHRRWFNIYMGTFPEEEDVDKTGRDADKKKGKRTWGKQKTKLLWKQFVKGVLRFREGILNPELSRLFTEYLRLEAKRELERQRQMGNIGFGLGVPIRKVVKNKLVDMNKLPADVFFLAEGERFRILCDTATEAAKAGTYHSGDQNLLENKAKILIECFLQSDTPPKLQINISQEIYENIEENFKNGMVDRGLFHDACMSIFPSVTYLWKKFQKYRISTLFCQGEGDLLTDKSKTSRAVTPDYMNINLNAARTIITHSYEEETKMYFSLSSGLRITRKTPRVRGSRVSAQVPPMARYSSMRQQSALLPKTIEKRDSNIVETSNTDGEQTLDNQRRQSMGRPRRLGDVNTPGETQQERRDSTRRRRSSICPSGLSALQNLSLKINNANPTNSLREITSQSVTGE